jgi:hypothetical protein
MEVSVSDDEGQNPKRDRMEDLVRRKPGEPNLEELVRKKPGELSMEEFALQEKNRLKKALRLALEDKNESSPVV